MYSHVDFDNFDLFFVLLTDQLNSTISRQLHVITFITDKFYLSRTALKRVAYLLLVNVRFIKNITS